MTTPEQNKLNPCPFCGSSRVTVRFYNQPSVVCEDCLAMGPAAQRLTMKPDNRSEAAAEACALWHKRGLSNNATLEHLRADNHRLRGIIARNALQRLRGKDATELYVTAEDIKESLEILYAWQFG